MNYNYKLKRNPEASVQLYCGLGFNFKAEPHDIDAGLLCFEFVA